MANHGDSEYSAKKFAWGQCLCNFTEYDKTYISMDMLAKEFFDMYNTRLDNGM